MSALPKCLLCGCDPIRLIDGTVKHNELTSRCGMRLSVLTGDEWQRLMGRGEPVSIGELILPGIDGGEYPDCDIEWNSAIAEKLQEQLVVDDNTVKIPIYLGLPAPAVDGAVLLDAERYRWLHKQCRSGPLTIATVGQWILNAWSGDDIDSAIDSAIKGEG